MASFPRVTCFSISLVGVTFGVFFNPQAASILSAEDRTDLRFFESRVMPILEGNCYECHSHEAGKAKGGLVLDSRRGWEKGGGLGPAIIPGNPEASLVFRAVNYEAPELEMPPKKPLSKAEVEILRRWIAEGAVDTRDAGGDYEQEIRAEDLWSLQPIRDHTVPSPSVKGEAWTAVDDFVLSELEAKRMRPLPLAEVALVVRRLYFDLTGLPPSPESLDTWQARLQEDRANGTAELAVELLASEQFGERWARHWLDTARYAESNGNNRNRVFRYAWRYRNWVIDSHNEDQAYDEFLKQQLAGDLMTFDSAEERKKARIATGFLAIGPKPYFPTIVPFDPEEPDRAKYDWAAEQIDATFSGMLGLTVGCARCHDHKTDPIPTSDYYAVAGIFRSTEPRFGMWHHLFGVDEGQAQRDFLYDWNLLVLNDELLPQIAPLQKQYQPLVIEQNQIELRSRHWTEQIGRLEQKLKIDTSLTEESRKNLRKSITEKQDQLDADAIRRPLLEKEMKAMRESFAKRFDVESAMGVEDTDEPYDVHIRLAGEHHRRGALVERGLLSKVSFEGAPEQIDRDQSGRLQLAEWIVHPNNPLTARVAVNRVWYRLFGRGIVTTLDNFGNTGEKPTHPELLDHLAHRFVHDFKWSRKKLIHYLVTSRLYQLASDERLATSIHFERDPENSLYWRTQPRRLDAEAIRDAMLAVSGRLDLARPEESPLVEFEYHADIVHPEREKALAMLGSNLRTVYVPTLRSHRNRLYELFDYPDDEAVNSVRTITTVPTQALFLVNNPFVMDLSTNLARRVHDEAGPDANAKLKRLYQLCLGRVPDEEEIAKDLTFLNEQAQPANGNESIAWERLAHSILISGEFLMRR